MKKRYTVLLALSPIAYVGLPLVFRWTERLRMRYMLPMPLYFMLPILIGLTALIPFLLGQARGRAGIVMKVFAWVYAISFGLVAMYCLLAFMPVGMLLPIGPLGFWLDTMSMTMLYAGTATYIATLVKVTRSK